MTRTTSTARAAFAVPAGVAMGCLLLYGESLAHSPRALACIAMLAAVSGACALACALPQRRVTLGSVYFSLFAVFHVGLLPYVALNATPQIFESASHDWFASPSMPAAVRHVAIGMLAFLLGYGGYLLYRNQTSTIDGAIHGQPIARTDATGIIGAIALAIGVLVWFWVAIRDAGLWFFSSSYISFLENTHGPSLPLAYLLIGLGVGAVAASPISSLRHYGLTIFAAFAIPAFAIGLRGEVIIPAAAWLVLAARRRRLPLRRQLLPAALIMLSIGSVVRQVRQYGLGSGNLADVSASPLDGLAELGFTIRTVVVTHHWHATLAEPFIGWSTYWAPLERLVVGRLLGMPVPSAVGDDRVFSATMLDRVGPIGGSPVAESYRAAGLAGILVIMLIIGIAVAWLDLQPSGSQNEAAIGMVGFVLLLWIRNDFTPVIFELLLCVALLIGGRILQRSVRVDGAASESRIGA